MDPRKRNWEGTKTKLCPLWVLLVITSKRKQLRFTRISHHTCFLKRDAVNWALCEADTEAEISVPDSY